MASRQLPVGKYFAILIELLRERQQFIEEISQSIKLKSKITALLICSSLLFAIYGAIIGSFQGGAQTLSSAIKLPALYLITLIVCFPTLYFFNILFGSKKSFGQHFAMLMTAVSVISVLLFSFAAVALFFRITTNNYQFFILLNVAFFGITGFIGIKFFYQGMQMMSQQDSEGAETRRNLLQFWLVLYAFVGTQLAWTLRPFFGRAGTPFVLFREMEGNFYLSIMQSLAEIFSLP